MGARGVEATYNYTMSPGDSKLCQWTAIATLTIPPAKQAAGKRTLSGSWVQAAADGKAHARNIQFHAIAVDGTSLTHRTALHTASRRASCRRGTLHRERSAVCRRTRGSETRACAPGHDRPRERGSRGGMCTERWQRGERDRGAAGGRDADTVLAVTTN